MTAHDATRSLVVGAVMIAGVGAAGSAMGQTIAKDPRSPQQAPLPAGQRIEARDGDVVVIEGEARVRIVRRREGHIRAIFNPTQRWLILLADYASQERGAPDGLVDEHYHFTALRGDWPLGERWEGDAILEDSRIVDQGSSGTGLRTAQGLIEILSASPYQLFKDPEAMTVLTFQGEGRGRDNRLPFDVAEQREVETVLRNSAARSNSPTTSGSFSMTTDLVAAPGVVSSNNSPSGSQAQGDAFVRVGGNIPSPAKTQHVAPVYPEEARRAGVNGTVVLELTIRTDGRIIDARILRSIPLLDAAALEAVRQWRYEPTLLNGRPVAVKMTATVSFTP